MRKVTEEPPGKGIDETKPEHANQNYVIYSVMKHTKIILCIKKRTPSMGNTMGKLGKKQILQRGHQVKAKM